MVRVWRQNQRCSQDMNTWSRKRRRGGEEEEEDELNKKGEEKEKRRTRTIRRRRRRLWPCCPQPVVCGVLSDLSCQTSSIGTKILHLKRNTQYLLSRVGGEEGEGMSCNFRRHNCFMYLVRVLTIWIFWAQKSSLYLVPFLLILIRQISVFF